MAVFRKDPPTAEPRADAATRPTQLTGELLDWLQAALEAVLRSPQLQELSDRRVAQAIKSAYILSDHLHPYTVEVKAMAALHQAEHWPTGVSMEAYHGEVAHPREAEVPRDSREADHPSGGEGAEAL